MINKITLPEAAKAKLHELVMARDAALDAGRSVNTRLQALSSDADPHMRAKLAAERDKQNHRHGQLHQLTSRISQWLTELRPGVVLEAALGRSSVRYRPRVLGTAIAAARDEKAARGRLVSVKAAPLPRDDQQKLAVEYVFRLGQTARPTVSVVGDRLRVGWRGDIAHAEDAVALLCNRGAACPRRCSVGDARKRRLAELEAQIFELEFAEEPL